jgi:hypothetical protein
MNYLLDIGGLGLGEFALIIVLCVLVFLAIRELLCWYYKINKMVYLMSEMNENLKRLLIQQGGSPAIDENKKK